MFSYSPLFHQVFRFQSHFLTKLLKIRYLVIVMGSLLLLQKNLYTGQHFPSHPPDIPYFNSHIFVELFKLGLYVPADRSDAYPMNSEISALTDIFLNEAFSGLQVHHVSKMRLILLNKKQNKKLKRSLNPFFSYTDVLISVAYCNDIFL